MEILFGNKEIDTIRANSQYTVLELDTIQVTPNHETETAYCLISDLTIEDMVDLEKKKQMHHDMMDLYKHAQWQQCRELALALRGSWQGAVDSFYDEILQRLTDLEQRPIAHDWTGVYRAWRN
jgi:hypothetical protein